MSHMLKPEIISQTEIPDSGKSRSRRDSPLILVVDDERAIAQTLSIILSRSGFSTMTAYSGEEALEVLARASPNLLISDVVMPGITGVELAIRTRRLLPSCGILLFSGQASTADLLSEARRSGHDFITLAKPVHPAELLRCISGILGVPIPEVLRRVS